jgi:hypothetical protein
MTIYVFIIQHDKGEVRIKTHAKSLESAKDAVCAAEDCPRSALNNWFIEVSKKELKRTKEWIASF